MDKTYRLSQKEQKELLSVLARLVAVDSSQKNESQVVKVCESYLRKWGVKSKKFKKTQGRDNLIWSLGPSTGLAGARSTSSGQAGRRQTSEILIAAHSDIVPAGKGWKTDPFKLLRKNGKLYGRGVVDNKSPLAAMLLATRILKQFESKLQNKIIFAAVADEESGNKFGMDYLLERKAFHPTAAIIPDSCGNNREVEIAEKGVVHLCVRAFGQQGHGSMPEKSKNAIFILKDFLRQVRKLRFTKKTKLLTPATISVGSFHAGEAANVIPGEAEALLDIRYPPSPRLPPSQKLRRTGRRAGPLNESKTQILKKLQAIAAAESKKWKVRKFRFEILADLPPSETSEKSSIVQKSLEAIKKVSRKKAKVIGMPAFTFGGILRSRGVPVVGFGPGDLHECHRANEKIREKEVFEFCEILVETLKRIKD